MAIQYVVGDATNPIKKPAIIAHVCNDQRGWGAGFVLAITRKWKKPEKIYREAGSLSLGTNQYVLVEDGIIVANMVAQHGFRSNINPVPLCYGPLETCLRNVASFIKHDDLKWSVHMPRIGCGLAGGKWELVEPIIDKALAGIDVFVYDLK